MNGAVFLHPIRFYDVLELYLRVGKATRCELVYYVIFIITTGESLVK